MSEYSEHDKLLEVKDRTQAIGEFIDWMSSEYSAQLMTYDFVSSEWRFPRGHLKVWLAEWAGIDLSKLEAEKTEMLKKLREMNEEGDDAEFNAADAGSAARSGTAGDPERGEGAEPSERAR